MIRRVQGSEALSHSGIVTALMHNAFPTEYGEAWTESQLKGSLLMPGIHLYLAETDKVLTGFALTRTLLDECELLLIAVDPIYRGQSIGTDILIAIEHQLRAESVAKIFLEMRENNGAVRLYQKFGFIIIGQRPGYYRGTDGQKFDALTFAKSLL